MVVRLTRSLWLPIAAIALLFAGCASTREHASPLGPTNGATEPRRLHVGCQATIFVGEQAPCTAAVVQGESQTYSTMAATWSSLQPDILDIDAPGVVRGRAPGTAGVLAKHQGLEGVAQVSVVFEDGLRVTGAAEQGDFRVGAQVTLFIQGVYSVASAPSGRLELLITNQDGLAVAAGDQRTVTGTDAFVVSMTFRVPDGATRLCRQARLRVGSTSFVEPTGSALASNCVPVS